MNVQKHGGQAKLLELVGTGRQILDAGRAGYGIVTLDFTVAVPAIRSAAAERVADTVGGMRQSLFAYQFVVAAVPA